MLFKENLDYFRNSGEYSIDFSAVDGLRFDPSQSSSEEDADESVSSEDSMSAISDPLAYNGNKDEINDSDIEDLKDSDAVKKQNAKDSGPA